MARNVVRIEVVKGGCYATINVDVGRDYYLSTLSVENATTQKVDGWEHVTSNLETDVQITGYATDVGVIPEASRETRTTINRMER